MYVSMYVCTGMYVLVCMTVCMSLLQFSWEAGTWLIDPITLEPIEYQYDTRLLLGGVTEQTSIAYAPIEYTNIRK